MRAINVLLSIVVSVVIAALVFEGGLRLMGLGPTGETINQYDADLGWSKRPNFVAERKTSEFDVTYRINELGLRDDPMASPQKPAGTYRVLVLGDSFVLGYTVDRSNLFVDQLEGLWQSEGRKVDVINAGTEGYSTDQEVAWFLKNGQSFEPDLVLLLPYENDLYWNSQETYQAKPKPRFSASGQLEERVLENTMDKGWQADYALTKWFAKKGESGDHYWEHSPGQKLYKEYAPLLVDEPPFMADVRARTKGALMALQGECTKVGAELVVVPIPSKEAYSDSARQQKQRSFGKIPAAAWDAEKSVKLYLELAGGLGIRTLDPRPAIKAASMGDSLYYERDPHLNAAGNRVLAEFLDAELAGKLNVFGSAHAKQQDGSFPESSNESQGIATWMKVFAVLWILLTALYIGTYRDEAFFLAPFKIFAMLALIFSIFFGVIWLTGVLPPKIAQVIPILFVIVVVGFVIYKMGRKVGTIGELFKAFTLRGHWYLMPLVVVLLTIGSLLVVAASSPLVAPFIYTLF